MSIKNNVASFGALTGKWHKCLPSMIGEEAVSSSRRFKRRPTRPLLLPMLHTLLIRALLVRRLTVARLAVSLGSFSRL